MPVAAIRAATALYDLQPAVSTSKRSRCAERGGVRRVWGSRGGHPSPGVATLLLACPLYRRSGSEDEGDWGRGKQLEVWRCPPSHGPLPQPVYSAPGPRLYRYWRSAPETHDRSTAFFHGRGRVASAKGKRQLHDAQ